MPHEHTVEKKKETTTFSLGQEQTFTANMRDEGEFTEQTYTVLKLSIKHT